MKPLVEKMNVWLLTSWRADEFAKLCRLLGRDFHPDRGDMPFPEEKVSLTIFDADQAQKDTRSCGPIAINALHLRAASVMAGREFTPSLLPKCGAKKTGPKVCRLLRVRHAAMLLMGAIHDDQ